METNRPRELLYIVKGPNDPADEGEIEYRLTKKAAIEAATIRHERGELYVMDTVYVQDYIDSLRRRIKEERPISDAEQRIETLNAAIDAALKRIAFLEKQHSEN